jgi:hypothetical protein
MYEARAVRNAEPERFVVLGLNRNWNEGIMDFFTEEQFRTMLANCGLSQMDILAQMMYARANPI